jgi:lactate permease
MAIFGRTLVSMMPALAAVSCRALTGTDAGSNALFGNLQKVTAEQLNLSPILMGAANSAGGVMGKMIDAQSIVVASAATQQVGNEAAIFKAVFWHSTWSRG